MIRRCDGTDPNLLREDEDGTYVPCNCGRVFDDVLYMTIYPHDDV